MPPKGPNSRKGFSKAFSRPDEGGGPRVCDQLRAALWLMVRSQGHIINPQAPERLGATFLGGFSI